MKTQAVTTFFFEGDPFFHSLREAIAGAKQCVDVELYYFADDPIGRGFGGLFKKKSGEGVRVRMIYDAVGCRETPSHLFEDLERSGVLVKKYNPLLPPRKYFDRRNHRKMIVIDQRIGFLGGFNLAAEYSEAHSGRKAWRDSGVRFEEPELAGLLNRLFEDSWSGRRLRVEDFIQKKTPRPDWTERRRTILASHGWKRKSPIREEYLSAILHAQNSISITNSYFIPDRGIRRALRKAALRGVDVKFMMPGPTDVSIARWAGQATYASFLKAGVRIFEYQPRVLHAKNAVIDHQWYTVGTSNLDPLSFFRNLEVNFIGKDAEEAKIFDLQFAKDIEFSKEIRDEKWKLRPWWRKLRERFCFFFRAWL